MRVVLAPDKFKGCLTAAEVAAAVGGGILTIRPDTELTMVPVADGGDGTVAAAVAAGYTQRTVRTVGPTGEPHDAPYAVAGDRAVVELAAAVGLDLLPDRRLDPLNASTFGLGLVVADALDHGATEIVLGLGGSASTDGGAGLVQALGARLTDASGVELAPGGASLATLAAIDLEPLRARLGDAVVTVATDVDNPLLGPNGAAAVFGPQKGAGAKEIDTLESALTRWAEVVAGAVGRDERERAGAGAAGGAGFAAIALLDARIRPGIDVIMDLLDLDDRLAGADLVITGEGSLDTQSLAGKAPVGVARRAARAGIPVVAVAGRSLLDDDQLTGAGIAAAYPLSALEPDLSRSLAHATPLLAAVGAEIAKEWLRG